MSLFIVGKQVVLHPPCLPPLTTTSDLCTLLLPTHFYNSSIHIQSTFCFSFFKIIIKINIIKIYVKNNFFIKIKYNITRKNRAYFHLQTKV